MCFFFHSNADEGRILQTQNLTHRNSQTLAALGKLTRTIHFLEQFYIMNVCTYVCIQIAYDKS